MKITVKITKAGDQRQGTLCYAALEMEFQPTNEKAAETIKPGPVFQIAGKMTVHGFSVQRGSDGNAPWVGFPQKQGADGKWWNVVHPDNAMRAAIAKLILNALARSGKAQKFESRYEFA